MSYIVKLINLIFQIIFFPLKFLPEIWALIIISVLTGIVMLLVFRATSNQQAIKKTKNKIKAYILELVLYKDNFKIIIKAIGNIFRYNGRYLRQTLIPLIIVFIPVVLILIQLNYRYQYRNFKPGENTIVKVKLNDNGENSFEEVKLLPSDHYAIETPALRLKDLNELNWRIRILSGEAFDLRFENQGSLVKKSVNRADRIAMLSPKKGNWNLWEYFLSPTEDLIPDSKLIKSIEIQYPNEELKIFGYTVHWLVIFFVVSLIAAFGLKGIFHVEI